MVLDEVDPQEPEDAQTDNVEETQDNPTEPAETPVEDAPATDEAEQEVEEPAPEEQETEEDDKPDPLVEKTFGKFKTKEGQIDLSKAAKSVHEAHATITKKSQELKVYSEKAGRFDQFQDLYEKDPELQAAVANSLARRQGKPAVVKQPEKPQPPSPEELNKQVSTLAAKNDWVGLVKVVTESANAPLLKKIEELESKTMTSEQRAEKERAEAAVNAEVDQFKQKFGIGILGKDGDPEVQAAMSAVYRRLGDVPLEDAYKLACIDMGRAITTKKAEPKPAPGKQAAMSKTGAPVKQPKVASGSDTEKARADAWAKKHGLSKLY